MSVCRILYATNKEKYLKIPEPNPETTVGGLTFHILAGKAVSPEFLWVEVSVSDSAQANASL